MSSKLLVLLLVIFFQIILSQNISQSNLENAIKTSDVYLEKIHKELMIPGIVAGISLNGTQVWAHAVGYTDIENDVLTRVDSVWRVASISKSLTSALIGRLIDEKRIDLNKSVHEYLKPDIFPIKKWNNKNVTITVGQVMSHTAGLHVMNFPDDLYKNLTKSNVTETIAQFKDEPLQFEPGTNFNYSNYGFQMIGAIIESILNETYESAINKMFAELEMNTTFCERREKIIRNRARYYMKVPVINQKPKIVNTMLADDLVSLEANWPSGGIVSTIPDLLKFGSNIIKWSKGLNASKTFNLSGKSISNLWSPAFDITKLRDYPSLSSSKYAHGWFISDFDKPIACSKCKSSSMKQIVWHSGGIAGVTTLLVLDPQNDIVFSIFANSPILKELMDIFKNIITNFVE